MQVPQPDWIGKWAVYSPLKTAVKEYETGRALTYLQLDQLGHHLAWRLTGEMGFKKGDRIAIVAENCLEYIALFSMAQKTGIILVPLNYRLAAAEIDYLLQNADPKLVIHEAKFEGQVVETEQYGKVPHHWKLEDLHEWCERHKEQRPERNYPPTPLDEDDPVFILYTSGTTGFPKGALYTHKMLFWNSINTAMSLIVNSDSRTVNCMPPFHTGGWNVLNTPFLHHGGYQCLMKKFDAHAVLNLLQEEKCTVFMGVPTMLKMIADEEAFREASFPELYYIIVGGEPMPVPLIERWDEKGVAIRQGYGMTEVGPNLTSLHQDDAIRKKGSIGRHNFYVNIRIVAPDGNDVATNESGELLLKGPMVTPGYWRNPEATQKSIVDGWFYTGDMVRQDAEGYLYVVDRIKNMFISGGENVYPAEIERVIISHPAVSEVAVIGVPHEKWGEVGKAFVATRAPMNEAEIIAHCKEKLAKFKVPKYVQFIDALPKNDTGKVDKRRLKELYSNQSGLGIYHLLFLVTTALQSLAEAKASPTFCALY